MLSGAAGAGRTDPRRHADRSGNGLRTAQRELSRNFRSAPLRPPLRLQLRLRCRPGGRFPNQRRITNVIPSKWAYQTGLRTAHFRDPNGPQVTFANEQFMDEIAAVLKVDPIEFRLSYLDPARRARHQRYPTG